MVLSVGAGENIIITPRGGAIDGSSLGADGIIIITFPVGTVEGKLEFLIEGTIDGAGDVAIIPILSVVALGGTSEGLSETGFNTGGDGACVGTPDMSLEGSIEGSLLVCEDERTSVIGGLMSGGRKVFLPVGVDDPPAPASDKGNKKSPVSCAGGTVGLPGEIDWGVLQLNTFLLCRVG